MFLPSVYSIKYEDQGFFCKFFFGGDYIDFKRNNRIVVLKHGGDDDIWK